MEIDVTQASNGCIQSV